MAKNKNTKMKKTRGSITNIDFIDGHIKVELQDEDLIVGTADIDLANLPYPVVDNVMGELLRYVEEIPEVVKVAEKYFDEYTEPYGASTKKTKKVTKASTAGMDEAIRALESLENTMWEKFIDAEISDGGSPTDFYELEEVLTATRSKYLGGHYTDEYGASTKKSKMKKSDSQYRVYDDSGEEYIGDKGTILNVVGNMLDGLDLPLVGRGSITLTFECMDNSGYEASTKKSKTEIRKENVTEIEVNGEPYYIWESFNGFKGSKENPNQFITNARAVLDFDRRNGFESMQDVIDYVNRYFVKSTKKSVPKIDMSFEDNVNKMRQANYAKTGNINTVMKKRD